MDTLKKYAVEVTVTVWLVIVAVQFLNNYFIGVREVDFTFAYIGMLCLILGTAGWNAFKAIRSHFGRREE